MSLLLFNNGKERDDAQMTKPAEIIHAGLGFLCRFAKRLVERRAARLMLLWPISADCPGTWLQHTALWSAQCCAASA